MNLFVGIEQQSQAVKVLLGLALIGAVGALDTLTGHELSFSLFYVIPISSAAWLLGRRYAIMASIVSALVWLAADVISGHVYSLPFILIWNTLIRLVFFAIVALLLSALKISTDRERELARTDYLTGAINSRLFLGLLQGEIDRLQRYEHPFTLVYFDLDNFKAVNDQFGHLTGDKALRAVVGYAREHLRKTDMIARMGGDEFALLLPETDQESARILLAKLQDGLLFEMRQNNWPITFSVGVLTCEAAPPGTDELIRMADELAYKVKHRTKNAIEYSTYRG
ncbi:MAG: GGDEF domain-containing protein [candidate division Zixibacteria bacterium]|nr:GGDEF domain-containing protein [candidate division Zixibacteria bacterium]